MARPFEIVDVFTDRPFAGNQLAVVTDARGLDTAAMQAIAREFNFAESTFLFPPADPANTARVRIFTPAEEMPFAGHPNVGTAYVLGRMGELFGRPIGDRMVFEEPAGLVKLELLRSNGVVTGARCRAPRALAVGTPVDPAIVAELAGLAVDDIDSSRFPPCFASVGAEFLFAEVSTGALEHARPDTAAFERRDGHIGQSGGLLALHLHVRTSGPAGAPDALVELDARMFAPIASVPEDAATGSAAAALGALLNRLDPTCRRFRVSQGRHIGRPSEIAVEAGPDQVWIGGPCAPFAKGMLSA